MQDFEATSDKTENTEIRSNFALHFFLAVLRDHRKALGMIVGSVFLLSVLLSSLLPKTFMATARIIPPMQNNGSFSSFLSNANDPLANLASELVDNQSPASRYVGIMQSRTVADALNREFDLKHLWRKDYIEDVYDKLAKLSSINFSSNNQIITVSVIDRSPQRAADLANAYVRLLDHINQELNITQSKRKRLFLEERLKEVDADLADAETELKAFKEKYHLVSINEQAKAAIEGAAEIKSQIISAQTELEVLKQFGTEKQIEAVMLKARISELQKQLDAITQGYAIPAPIVEPAIPEVAPDFYIPLDKLPDFGMQLMRLTRDAKIQEKLFELLTSQYEMARIEEARDVDTVQVLDKAVTPEKAHGPKKLLIVTVLTMISLIFSITTVFFIAYFKYAFGGCTINSK